MNAYIVHWVNFEEYDEMGAALFSDLDKAILFLKNIITENYPGDHIDDLDDDYFENIDWFDQVIDSERLFPYGYKITKISIL